MFQAIADSKVIFPDHLPLVEIQRGIKSGKYLQGSFLASRENYLEANVSVHNAEKMVCCPFYVVVPDLENLVLL